MGEQGVGNRKDEVVEAQRGKLLGETTGMEVQTWHDQET